MTFDWYTTGALVLLVAWLLWKYLSWNYSYWQRLGVPCPQPSVPFGNVKELVLGKKPILEVYQGIYWQMEGHPFCGFYHFREPIILVRDAALVRQMFVKDFSSFHDNNAFVIEEMDPIFAKNPFFLKGERWRKLRTQLSPSFTASRLKPMFPLIKEVCDDLVRVVKKEGPKTNTDGVDVWQLCLRYTTDVVCSCALGVKGYALEDEDSHLLKMIQSILEPNAKTILTLLLNTNFPSLASLFRLSFMPEEVHKFMHKLVGESVAAREHEVVHRNDYLQILVELKTKGHLDSTGQVLADRTSFTDVDVVAQAMTFITDGTHTSATAMMFALYELALHPDIQQRLREEVRQAVDKHGGQLGYDAIQECSYLDMVLSESLRVHTPLSHLEKKCTVAYPLQTASGRSFTLQPGTTVVVSTSSLHSDPRYFPNPDVFDPERFSPSNKDHTSMQAYMPFGLGPRTCIGQRFALSQLKMGISTVVSNFTVTATPRTPVPLQLDSKGFLKVPKGGMWLGFQPLDH